MEKVGDQGVCKRFCQGEDQSWRMSEFWLGCQQVESHKGSNRVDEYRLVGLGGQSESVFQCDVFCELVCHSWQFEQLLHCQSLGQMGL